MNKTPFIVYFKMTKAPARYLLRNGNFRGEIELNKLLSSGKTSIKASPGISSFFDITSDIDVLKLQRWVNKNKTLFGVSSGTPDISAVLGYYIKFLKRKSLSGAPFPSSLTAGPKNEIVQLLEGNKNLIIQGAPGVGKTYITRKIAVSICDGDSEAAFNKKYPDSVAGRNNLIKRYDDLVRNKRIRFITFHQSLDYEEFVEGLKPDIDPSSKRGTGTFSVKSGLFKNICEDAKGDESQEPYVLIIDEINRANISKVLGELITLIEPSKRESGEDPYSVILPYSQEEFSVPDNLYIIGTMNTADRSLGSIDYAIRRRFAFKTLVSDVRIVPSGVAQNYFTAIRDLICEAKDEDFETDDIMVGHSYFMGDFENNLTNKIIPLLLEYFRDGVLVYDKLVDDGVPVFSSGSTEPKSEILRKYLEKKAEK